MGTQTVRTGGILWLNPNSMSDVNCSRAEMVKCSEAVLLGREKKEIFVLCMQNKSFNYFCGWIEKKDGPI